MGGAESKPAPSESGGCGTQEPLSDGDFWLGLNLNRAFWEAFVVTGDGRLDRGKTQRPGGASPAPTVAGSKADDRRDAAYDLGGQGIWVLRW
jgi:hypothetical protein